MMALRIIAHAHTSSRLIMMLGLVLILSACQAGANRSAEQSAADHDEAPAVGRTADSESEIAPSRSVSDGGSNDRVFFARGNPGPEILATGVPWMPFLRQIQMTEWNADRTRLGFYPERMRSPIAEILPQIEETGFLMLDLETGPRAKELGALDEWVAGVEEAVRIAKELSPEGTIVGTYPAPSHVRRFTDDSFRTLGNVGGLFFPIHTMDRQRLEAFAAEIEERGFGDRQVAAYLWQFMDPPEGSTPPSEPSLWQDQGVGEWVPEAVIRQRVRDALDIFDDPRIVIRGKGAQAARAIEIALEVVDENG